MKEKQELRLFYKSIRNSISKNDRLKYSEEIAEKVFSTDLYKSCKVILTFVSINSEVETKFIIDRAFRDGKIVAVPRTENKSMEFVKIDSINELEKGEYNIPTAPSSNKKIEDFSSALCIVPCLSADLSCHRLGYGGGYYDRFFAIHPDVKSICICFDNCVALSLPKEEFDKAVDICITEKRMFGGVPDVR